MSVWQWQDDVCWQASSARAKKQAAAWQEDTDGHYKKLAELAAKQPLTAIGAAELNQCRDEAAALSNVSKQLVVIGTGGASLGAQTLCALSNQPSRVRFLENCDPVTLDVYFQLPKEETSWCIISKSGETVETLAGTLALIGHYSAAMLKSRIRVVTTEQDSTLMRIAKAQGWKVLPHPPSLGGRFSVFSVVGLLPAAYADLPIESIANAASTCMKQLLATRDAQLLTHASWLAANLQEKPIQVLMAYADRLRAATQWYKQLWAESLGKDGKGGTPVTAIGAIDQHSQLQLYLDGPRDKLITLWLPTVQGMGAILAESTMAGVEYLRGHRMGDVMQATAEATATTLAKAGVPLRVLRGTLTVESMAHWMARQMLETLLVAQLIGVDPFSQPAVEAGKKLTRSALAGAS